MKDSPGNAGTFRLMMDVLMKIPPGSSNVIVKGQGFEPHQPAVLVLVRVCTD